MKDEPGEIRCGSCNRMLAKGTLVGSIKCPRCGTMNVIQSATADNAGRSAQEASPRPR